MEERKIKLEERKRILKIIKEVYHCGIPNLDYLLEKINSDEK